jgi:ferritin-like metal-binding protein YciE
MRAEPGATLGGLEFSSPHGSAAADESGMCFAKASAGRKTGLNLNTIMSKLTSLEVLLVQEIKDLYSAETQLVKALPKMAKAASDPDLKKGFEGHLEETKGHVERLEEIAKLLDASPKGKVCKAMKGLVEEGGETIEEDGDPTIKDLALITAAQKVEHYEISGYGSARALAEALGLDDVVDLLQATLDEEGNTDKKLTSIAEKLIPTAHVAAAGA